MAKLKMRGIGPSATKELESFVNNQLTESNCPPIPFIIGKKYIIRTITMINVGRLINIIGNFMILDDASWIADAGRWEECLIKPEGIKISEKYKKPVLVNVHSIVDATEWELELPKESISRR